MAEYVKKMELKEIPLADIEVGKRITGIDEENVEGLVVNIMEVGLMNPITVKMNERTGKYVLIAGNHRKTAFERLKREYIPAMVIEEDDELTYEQRFATTGLMEIAENLNRKKLSPSELCEMEEALDSFRSMLPKDFRKAKIEKERLEAAIEFAKGKEKEMLKNRIKKLDEIISKENNNTKGFNLREALLSNGYPSMLADSIITIYETSKQFGKGSEMMKALEKADIEPALYRSLSQEIKQGNISVVKDIIDKKDTNFTREVLNNIRDKRNNEKEEKRKKLKEDSVENKLNIENVMPNYTKVNDNDFITTELEDKFLRRSHEIVIRHKLNSTLVRTIYSALNNEYKFLVICENKRELDRLVKTINENFVKQV